MPRRDLHRAGTQLRIGMIVGDDLDEATGDRQAHVLAHQMRVAFVFLVHRHRHVGEHRLGPRRRHLDETGPVFQWIAQLPELPLDLARLDLEIADRGAKARIPVHQPLVAVQQPLFVQVHEHFEHGLRKALVHREAFVFPIHRTAQAAKLLRYRAAALLLPFPHFGHELVAREVGALLLLQRHVALDHHLRRDAGMVGADHP